MTPEQQKLLKEYFDREYKIEIENWHIERGVVFGIVQDILDPEELWATLSTGVQVGLSNVHDYDVDIYKPISDWTDERNLV